MHSETDIGIGTLIVNEGVGWAEVSIIPYEGAIEASLEDGTVTFTTVSRKPVKNSEITQNGSTFEVIDVRENGSGYDVLNGNTKTWEKWVED